MVIIPAILEKSCEEAIVQIGRLHGVSHWLQIDVMDDTYVSGTTCDVHMLSGHLADFSVEVHLMVDNPEAYFDACADIGAQRVYFHLDAVDNAGDIITMMDAYNFEKGIALSPHSSLDDIADYIPHIDAVQIMTVVPGLQGQEFMPEMLERVEALKADEPHLWISVDGGVNAETISDIVDSGADAAGVGSALSHSDDAKKTWNDLQNLI